MGFNWKKLIGGAAPAIAAALGVGGGPAGIAVTALSRALLGHDKGTEDDVAEAIGAGATPEQIEKIQAAEREFSLKVIDEFVALEKIDADDRANARAMQIAAHSHTPDVVTFLVIGLFACEMFLAHFFAVPPDNRDAASQVAGVLNISMGTALGFWLGGSLGQRSTNAALLGKLAGKKG